MSTICRQPGWEARLVALADFLRGQRFCWGRTDCAQIAFQAFDALVNAPIGLTAAYRHQYASRASALRFQRRYHIDAAHVLRESGCIEVEPAYAQRGDILVGWKDGFACAHVVLGERVLSSHPDRGVFQTSVRELLAWPGLVGLRVPG